MCPVCVWQKAAPTKSVATTIKEGADGSKTKVLPSLPFLSSWYGRVLPLRCGTILGRSMRTVVPLHSLPRTELGHVVPGDDHHYHGR